MNKTELALMTRKPFVLEYYKKYKNFREDIHFARENAFRIFEYHLHKRGGYYHLLAKKIGENSNIMNDSYTWNSLPVISKEDLRGIDIEKEKPDNNFTTTTTGGSTGEPLKYLMSSEDNALSMTLLFRGWGLAGYEIGDKVAVIAGKSLGGSRRNRIAGIRSQLSDYLLNTKHFPVTDLSKERLKNYCTALNKWKPKFLRGYVSSMVILAQFLEEQNLHLNFPIQGIMTTAEVLYPEQRKYIENIFGTEVYDNYGLNDSGVSAFECKYHNGFHIDNERSFVEIMDGQGTVHETGEGTIIGTSLFNRHFPFIRYNTGDLGKIEFKKCECGIEGRMITFLQGRETEILELNGSKIGGPVLTTIWQEINVKQYQIIQVDNRSIILKLVRTDRYGEKDEALIIERFRSYFGDIDIQIEYSDVLLPVGDSKYKYIIKQN